MKGFTPGVPASYVGGMFDADARPKVLGVRTHGDELLSAIAPLGLALAAGTALVVDLDPDGPPYPGDRSLAVLADEGPRRDEMEPMRAGVATIRNGGAETSAALDAVRILSAGWPLVVVRLGDEAVPFPVIPVRPLWPGFLSPTGQRAAVWQSMGTAVEPPGPGPILPPPGRSTVMALLGGRRPLHSRWVGSWRRVWGLPWR